MSDNEPKRGTIKYRNREGTIEANTLLWNAFCNKPKNIHKYMTRDGVLAQPDHKIYSPRTDPTFSDFVDEQFKPWTAYKIHDEPQFSELDLMATALVFRVTVWKLINGEMVGADVMCSSVWKQTAGGDWRCCLHHMAAIEDGDYDEGSSDDE